MNINTTEVRHAADSEMHDGKMHTCVHDLCDEIDRLREREKLLMEQCQAARTDASELHGEIEQLQNDLSRMQGIFLENEQWPAPRSIKDEPPKVGDRILICDDESGNWFTETVVEAANYRKFRLWLPCPPRPPAPDKFRVWFDRFQLGYGVTLPENPMRAAWDAALDSVKDQL